MGVSSLKLEKGQCDKVNQAKGQAGKVVFCSAIFLANSKKMD